MIEEWSVVTIEEFDSAARVYIQFRKFSPKDKRTHYKRMAPIGLWPEGSLAILDDSRLVEDEAPREIIDEAKAAAVMLHSLGRLRPKPSELSWGMRSRSLGKNDRAEGLNSLALP